MKKDSKMQNQFELETVSVRLYKYLCEEVVGSENIIRYRRLYFKLHDDMLTDMHREFISSGSKAEGLDLPGSDIDIMVLRKSWKVYEIKPKDNEDFLMLDTDNSLPGFALLKTVDNSLFPCFPTITADGNLISNRDFVELSLGRLSHTGNLFEIHGPCISHSSPVNIEMLRCFQCHTWPTIAKQWLSRFRPSGWPSQGIISKIVWHGCLLVPVGSKSSCSDGNPFEWRFSFSLSEKLLVHSFNHTQLLCYALLKIWLKEVLNSINILYNKLCSYFMKTVLFWILEEKNNLNWIPQNLLHCFLVCIHRLQYWIVCGYFPNYFIPEQNMIDGKISQDDLKCLSIILDKINLRHNWKLIFSAPSLSSFSYLSISIGRNPHRLSEFDHVVLSFQTFGSLVLRSLNKSVRVSISANTIYRLIHKDLPMSARNILILMFLIENKNILASIDIAYCSNKRTYLGYKGCLSRILINTFYDAESGWLLLAAYFYSKQMIQEMSWVLQLSTIIYSFKNSFVQKDVNIQSFRDMSKLKKLVYSVSFIKRMRYESSRISHIDYDGTKIDQYSFLSEEIPKTSFGKLQSYNLFVFLKFLYGRKHGNSLETKSALQLLKTIFEEECDKSKNVIGLASTYMILLKALELSNDEEGSRTCALRYLKAIYKSDIFEALMKIKKTSNYKYNRHIRRTELC